MYQVRRVHIGKTAQLDELVRACERLYSHTLVSFWRTLRHKGIWLAPKHLMRWHTSKQLHAHTADACVQAFFASLKSWRERRKQGDIEASPPRKRKRTPFYGQREFQYEPEQDVYRCPNGALLHLEKHRYTERTKEYRADAAICNACPLKAHFTDSERGRSIGRSFDEEYLERIRAYHVTEPYHKAMRKRSVWVEPLFAEGKDWHGMRRFRLRLHRPGQLRSPAHRNWTKSQAPAQETRVGTPPIPNRGPLCLFLGPFMWGACSHGGKGRVCGAD